MDQARNVCIEMLESRGYANITRDEGELIIAERDDGDRIAVFFDENSKLTKMAISKYMSLMKQIGVTHSIVVYSDVVTNTTAKSVDNSIEMEIELFSKSELQFNITKHRLQPKSFQVLPHSEEIAFKKNFGVKFPVMRIGDPIARFYNYKKGNVIQILDKRDLVHYRIVR